jgi:DNA invertase Pin-like site-specific DNA recombinase
MNVVGYCRLSKDDNKSRYSSIESQQQLAFDYAQKRNWTIQKFYIDDDVTGFIENEKRPAFYEMLKDIEFGKIDVVIAKDLSRFGRKNSITLSNIDLFKELGINLILTKDTMLRWRVQSKRR